MKKLIATFAVGLLAAHTAMAAIDVSLVVQSSFGVNDPTIPGDTFDIAGGELYQLIWYPGLVAPTYNPLYGYTQYNPLNPTEVNAVAGEKLLGQWINSGGIVGVLDTQTQTGDSSGLGLPNDGLVQGFVYTRVFNVGAPGLLDYFNVGGLTGGPLGDQSQANPPAADTSDVAPVDLFTLSIQIVPEPSVLAFLGIGAAVVAIRRIRRS